MNKFAHALFCDDIRFELGNKVTYVGAYASELFSPGFPLQLPKLCISASAGFSPNEVIHKLEFRVYQDKTMLSEAPIPQEDLSSTIKSIVEGVGTPEDPIQVISFTVNIVLSPLVFEQPSTISVYAVINGEELIAGKLRVKRAA